MADERNPCWDIADDLSRSLFEVIEAAEQRGLLLELADAAEARLRERGWQRRDGHWVPPSIEWPQLLARSR